MKNVVFSIVTLVFLIGGVCGNQVIYAEEKEYHGADSVFQAEGIAIFWGILKGSDDESSLVHINIIVTDDKAEKFAKFSVLAVDPFSKEEKWVSEGREFQQKNLLTLNRASFRDMMERRFFFYASEENYKDKKPDMLVYYLSIPDTAPEFLEERELEEYFKDAITRLKKK
ncbi:MAG: hypothetical protein GY801_46915 [bacterium]|nr:hypothetical protein [bacterium]